MSSIRRFIENSEVTTHAHSIQAVNGGKTSGSFPSISPLLASISAHFLPAVSLDLSLRCLYPMLQADSTFYLLGSEHQARRVTRRRTKNGVWQIPQHFCSPLLSHTKPIPFCSMGIGLQYNARMGLDPCAVPEIWTVVCGAKTRLRNYTMRSPRVRRKYG